MPVRFSIDEQLKQKDREMKDQVSSHTDSQIGQIVSGGAQAGDFEEVKDVRFKVLHLI